MFHLHHKAEKRAYVYPSVLFISHYFPYKIAALEEQLKKEKTTTSQEKDLLVRVYYFTHTNVKHPGAILEFQIAHVRLQVVC